MGWALSRLAWVGLAACAGSPPEIDASRPPAPPSLELVRLAHEALGRGELDLAEQRFERVARSNPKSSLGSTGLGLVALSRGELATARTYLDRAVALDPEDVDARVGLAKIDRSQGNVRSALAHLYRARVSDPDRVDVHSGLAALTGAAPRQKDRTSEQVLRMAAAHPYDPWALVRGAEVMARAGRREEAIGQLELAVWLFDLDPASARLAIRRLRALDDDWRDRHIVEVHVYADETIRARAGWRFRLRSLLAKASASLSRILEIQFVPVWIGGFPSAQVPNRLDAIDAALARSLRPGKRPGIQLGFTERPLPHRSGLRKKGLAQFLGRRMMVRLEPEQSQSRVLVHEILHLYGAMHVVEDLDSLMNPTGGGTRLDRSSARIVKAMRRRVFRTGDPRSDVLPYIDLAEAIAAYQQALVVNLTFRRLGLEAAFRTRRTSRYQAANQAREAVGMDEHLADVLKIVASLLRADRRPAQALILLEAAARLYGPDTSRGRKTSAEAENLRRWLLDVYRVQ